MTRRRAVPPTADLERAAAMLGRAERPLLLAGTGALWSGAAEEVRCMAERLGAPVITTGLAKGLLPEDHPLSGGDMRGRLGRELMDAADLLLAVGVRFTQNDTGAWSQQIAAPIVQIDSEERELGAEYPAALGLAGDEKATLAQLLAALHHLQDEQIAVDVRFISVPQGFGDKVANKCANCCGHCPDLPHSLQKICSGSITIGATGPSRRQPRPPASVATATGRPRRRSPTWTATATST